MYNFYRNYGLNRADILNWTSSNPDRLELLYKPDQFLLDAHNDALPLYIPFNGGKNDGEAIDAYCQRLDAVWSGCTVTARLVVDFLTEEPAAAFFVDVVQSDGEKLECFGCCDISAEDTARLIAECLRRGAGLTEQVANGYRNSLLLHRLIKAVSGEHVPADKFSHPILDLLRAGQIPQAIADGLGAA